MSRADQYWDNDKVFRHHIAYEYLRRLGFQTLLANKEPYRIRISKLREEYPKLSNLLLTKSKGSSIDLDIFGIKNGILILLELKTRLIPRQYYMYKNIDVVYKKLRYHFDEPINAINTWNNIRSMNVMDEFDDVTSVGELFKALIGIKCHKNASKYLRQVDKVCFGMMIPQTCILESDKIYQWLLNVKDLASKYINKDLEPTIITYKPLKLNKRGIPIEILFSCIKDNCRTCNIMNMSINPNLPNNIKGCEECNYKEICKELCIISNDTI